MTNLRVEDEIAGEKTRESERERGAREREGGKDYYDIRNSLEMLMFFESDKLHDLKENSTFTTTISFNYGIKILTLMYIIDP